MQVPVDSSRNTVVAVFHNSIQLPADWDHCDKLVNHVDDELLDRRMCTSRIAQQGTFDKKPLGLAMCYGCGHLSVGE